MNADGLLASEATSSAIAELIATLHKTEQQLEVLTSGKVDTVMDREGRTLLLRRAQEHLRHHNETRQAAILNALPAHIALLDASGVVVSVNEVWQQFAENNQLLIPRYGIGFNYLQLCECAQGEGATEAHAAAAGIRAVLDGNIPTFSLEYPCHSPTEQRWFVMTVNLLVDDGLQGVVVMHVDISAVRHAEAALQARDALFQEMANSIQDVFFVRDPADGRMLYVSPAYEQLWGRSCASLYANPLSWVESIHPDDRAMTADLVRQGVLAKQFRTTYRILRPDGSIRWIESRGYPALDAGGNTVRIAGIARDITEQRRALEALRESERNLRAIFDGALDGILVADTASGRLVSANTAICTMLGYTREELVSLAIHAIVPEVDYPEAKEQVRQLTSGEIQTVVDARMLRKDGSVAYVDIKATVIVLDGKNCLLGVVRDIAERKRADARIAYLNRIYAVLSSINSLIVRAQDRDRMFKDACEVAIKAGGFRMAMIALVEQGTGNIVPIASAGKDAALVETVREALQSGKIMHGSMVACAIREKRAVVANDSANDGCVLFRAQYAEAGVHSLAVLPLLLSDNVVGVLGLYAGEAGFFQEEEMKLLTELAEDIAFAIDHIDKESRLNYLAYYDRLTGLANRTLFLERVTLHMRNATSGGHKLALMLIDLERFRYINGSLGRPAGDQLLKQVAEWLTVRVKDANLLARLDADHFALVLPAVTGQGELARQLGNEAAAFMEHPYCLNDAIFRVAIKSGIAIYPDDADTVETLFGNAEAALKIAKSSNSRFMFYAQSMNETAGVNLTLENRLRDALDKGQFELHYQPKVSFGSGKLTGIEALIRWNDPDTGQVLPGHFIPILEETGLIYKVGCWALRKAVADYLRWRAAGLPVVRIAVNVSSLQLRNPDFINDIEKVLSIDEHAAEGLELEITESLIMENVRSSIDSLKAIRALNVTIAIDDFGTGFSSLSYLAKLPVDTLKIDRSFVVDMTSGPEGLALVSTIIHLAHSLKLKVVAEGVETGEQARLLRLLGCDEMQGFLFSKPLPHAEFEQTFLAPGNNTGA